MDHVLMLFWFFVSIFNGYTTAWIFATVETVTYDVKNNASITLTCHTKFQGGAPNVEHSWIFHGKILTKNNDILAISPIRYNVKYKMNSNANGHVYTLAIPNPVQTDGGRYQCQIDYTWDGTDYLASRDVDVQINSYLPPLNDPLCSIQPSQTLTNGNIAKFECNVGETTAQITLKLTLQLDDGSVTHLNDSNVTRYVIVQKTVTLQDNKAMFICQMTSETFPTSYRNCTAGPLIISEKGPDQATQPIMRRLTTPSPETKLTTVAFEEPQNLVTTKPLLLTGKPEPSGRNLHAKQMSTKPEKKLTTEASKTTQNLMTTKPVTGTNQPRTSNAKHVSTNHTTGECSSTLFKTTNVTPENEVLMKDHDDEATGTLNMNIILISLVGLCQTLITTVIFLYMRWYFKKQRPTNESITLATSSDQVSPTIDSTNMPFQIDPESKPNAVLINQVDDSSTGIMTLTNSACKNIQTYEHTTELNSVATSNQVLQTVNSTYIPNQTDSKPEIKAVRMGVASLVKTKLVSPKRRMTLPNLVEFQNMHTYEHTIEMHSMATSSDQVS